MVKTDEEIASHLLDVIIPFIGDGPFDIQARDWRMKGEIAKYSEDGPLKITLEVDPCQLGHQCVCMFQAMLFNLFNIQRSVILTGITHNPKNIEKSYDHFYRRHTFESDDYWYEG